MTILSALRKARAFVADEQELRLQHWSKDAYFVRDATATLDAIEAAILIASRKVSTSSGAARSLAAKRWEGATEADREKVRANGRKGGRPKKKLP